MLHSLPAYKAITASLLEFLVAVRTQYDPPRAAAITEHVNRALHLLVSKRVVPSLVPIVLSEHLEPALCDRAREAFAAVLGPVPTPATPTVPPPVMLPAPPPGSVLPTTLPGSVLPATLPGPVQPVAPPGPVLPVAPPGPILPTAPPLVAVPPPPSAAMPPPVSDASTAPATPTSTDAEMDAGDVDSDVSSTKSTPAPPPAPPAPVLPPVQLRTCAQQPALPVVAWGP